MKNIINSAMLVLLLTTVGYGATNYVDGTSGLDTNPGTIQNPWKTIHKANITLVAGDTVYIRGGTYTVGTFFGLTEGIMPQHSGTAGNPITYSNYQDEVVNLIGQADIGISSRGIWLNGVNYIKVTATSLGKLNISKMAGNLVIGPWGGNNATADSTYNEISYVYFYNSYNDATWEWAYQGSLIGQRALYNHIHHCKFEKHGYMVDANSGNIGNLFELGTADADSTAKGTYYNVIENNEFLDAGHATFGFFGVNNVVRNNYFHNEGWYEYPNHIGGGYHGYRNIIAQGVPGYIGNNLFEQNRIGHAAPNWEWVNKNTYWGGTGMKLCSPNNIIRYNVFFNNRSQALDLATYASATTAKAQYNYIYNNTFYQNGWYGYPSIPYWKPIDFAYTGNGDWTVFYSSVFKNNLFYNNANTQNSVDVWNVSGNGSLANVVDPTKGNVTLANNFNASGGQEVNPLFVNTDLSTPSSWTLPNLNLQASSPAINGGSYLTQATNSGSSSTSLQVGDAQYFQDGKFGLASAVSWPASASIQADWVAVGTVTNVAQIISINYGTNTITLVSPLTWSNGASVGLYKKSDGAQVLSGFAPDYGAHELVGPIPKKVLNVRGY